jgi:hypothetical protein
MGHIGEQLSYYKLEGFKDAQDELRRKKLCFSLFLNQLASSHSNPQPLRSSARSHAGTMTLADAPFQRTAISRTFGSRATLLEALQ